MSSEETIQQLQRELQKQRKINAVLIARVEQGMSEGAGAFAMFERAISLEKQVKERTLALSRTMQQLDENNAQLESVNARLLEIDKMKSDFLSSVSHELRTPLTSIRGFVSLIAREFSRSFAPLAGADAVLQRKSGRINDNLAIVLKESERLTRLINDVLDLAKIESGRTEWRDSRIRIDRIVGDAINAVRGMFDQKPEVELRVDVPADLPPVLVDADKLQQVLVNLLNNAAKFTDHGEVAVTARLDSAQMIEVEIRDTGIGFPPQEADAIFDKFQQSSQGDTLLNRPKGTGLGLSIAREIVMRHGGRIWANSEPGKGSAFFLTLPAAAELPDNADSAAEEPEAASHGSTPHTSGGKPTVLVADDDAGVRSYLTQLLQEHDYQVVTVADGQAAVAAAKECRPDLITMDLAMPVMDGRTAILQLRADPDLQHVPIMVISAIQGWEEAGGDLSMNKPLDEPRFLENLHLLMGRDTAADKLRVLVLHEAGELPSMTPGSFSTRCSAELCPLDQVSARIEAGFQGMVMIPTDLMDKVDLGLLQATPTLEVMIMPMQARQSSQFEIEPAS